MHSSQQDITPLSPPEPSQTPFSSFIIPHSSYLTVPSIKPSGSNLFLPGPTAFEGDHTKLLVPLFNPVTATSVHFPSEPLQITSIRNRRSSPFLERDFASYSDPIYMSVYSSTSTSSEHSTYSNPPARIYRVPSFQKMSGSRKISVVCFISALGRFPKIHPY
jgi:hypothetical protein